MSNRFKPSTERLWNTIFFAVAAAAGFLDVWLLVGWREIDPQNLSWLSGDSAVYQIGWEFFRSEKIWQFPPTWIARLDYPTGVSASYLDFIPLVGVPLRFFSFVLPAQFQYLGLYAVVCFSLQAYFGFKVSSLFAKGDRIVTLIGGAFFLVSPILTKELYGHFALLTHWIVLACIYYYFRMSGENSLRANLGPFVVLGAISAATQPYFALMANLIGAAAIFRAYTLRRTTGISQSQLAPATNPTSDSAAICDEYEKPTALTCAVWGLLLVCATVLSLTVFGFIVPGKSQFAGTGYTHYSMNLLAPINPQTPSALYFKSFAVVHGWTLAGYDYLGMGVLLLLFVYLSRDPTVVRELWYDSIKPLTIVSILCTCLALSVEVTFADHVLFTIPLPKFIFNLLASFRGSGRLFWPAYYLLSLAAFVGILRTVRSPVATRVILAAALAVQYLDVLAVRNGVAATAQMLHPDRLLSPDWALLPSSYRHLFILPAFACGSDTPGGLEAWPQFAHLAASGGMTLNSVYLSRMSPQTLRLDCVTIPGQVLSKGLSRDTAYVLSDKLALAIKNRAPLSCFCRRVDGFNLCTREPMRVSR